MFRFEWLYRVAGPGIFAAVTTFLVSWLVRVSTDFNVNLTPEQATAVWVAIWGTLTKAFAARINKGDAAVVPLARAENHAVSTGAAQSLAMGYGVGTGRSEPTHSNESRDR